MKKLHKLIRDSRLKTGWNATEAAKRLSISPQYLSRIENGGQIPSPTILEQMIQLYSVPPEDASMIREEAGYAAAPGALSSSPTTQQNMQIKVNAESTPVLFSNAILVSSDPYGIVIDAGQKVGISNEIQIVSRVGLSLEHAEKLNEALLTHIKKLRKNLEN